MVTFEVIGADRVERNIREMTYRARDMRPATRIAKGILEEERAEQFASRGQHLGTPWAENASATVARKGRDEPNVDSGKLQTAAAGGRGKSSGATRKEARAGYAKSLFYARFAQAGVEGHQPARPVVGISENGRRKILVVVNAYLMGGFITNTIR